MKISSFCCLAASFALAAAALTGCKTSSANGTCTDNGACTDKSSCAGEKAGSCCSTGEKQASACCASGEKTAAAGSAKLANTECPFSGGPAKSTLTVAYNGKTVGFCCAGCVSKWEAASDADRAAMLSKVAAK